MARETLDMARCCGRLVSVDIGRTAEGQWLAVNSLRRSDLLSLGRWEGCSGETIAAGNLRRVTSLGGKEGKRVVMVQIAPATNDLVHLP